MSDLFKKLFRLPKEVLLNRDTFLQWLSNQPDDRNFAIAQACPVNDNRECGCMLHAYFSDHLRKKESKIGFISVGSGNYLNYYENGRYTADWNCPAWCRDVVTAFDQYEGKPIGANTLVHKDKFVASICALWNVSLPPKQINEDDNFTITVKRLKEKRNFIAWLMRQPADRNYKTACGSDHGHVGACGCMLFAYINDHAKDSSKPLGVGMGSNIRTLPDGANDKPRLLISKRVPWFCEVVAVFDSIPDAGTYQKREPFLTLILQKWGMAHA